MIGSSPAVAGRLSTIRGDRRAAIVVFVAGAGIMPQLEGVRICAATCPSPSNARAMVVIAIFCPSGMFMFIFLAELQLA